MRLLLFLMLLIQLEVYAQRSVETVVQTGHYAPVLSLDCSPNGQWMVTASQDNTIKLWELATGRELRSFVGHTKSVYAVRFSPDNKEIISIGYDQLAIQWDILTGKIIRKLYDSTDVIRSAIFSPKGTYILTGGHKTNAILWDRVSGKRLKTYKVKPEVCYQCASSMAFSADEKTIFTSAQDRTTLYWSTAKEDTIRSLKFSKGSCSSCNTYVDIDPTGTILAKADYGGGLYTVAIKSGKILKELATDEDFKHVEFHPTGLYILGVVDYRGKVKIWDINTGEVIQEIEAHGGIKEASFSTDGKFVLTAGEDHIASRWNFRTGELVKSYQGVITKIKEKGLNSDELYFINLLKDTELSPDGQLVAQCKRGHSAILWDFYSGRIIKRLVGHESVVTCLDFSPDGKTIVTGSADRTIKLWNVATAELIRSITAHSAMVLSVKFSEDGKQVVSGSWDGLFKVWDVESGQFLSLGKVHKGSPYVTALTPNGIYAVSGGLDKALKMTELDTRVEVRSFIGHTNVVQSIEFSPDGTSMLTAGWDGAVRTWELKSGWQHQKLKGHQGKVYHASFDSSGHYIVSGGEDKIARLWDAKSGKLIRTFTGHQAGINYVKISPDQRYLLTSSRNNAVKIWDLKSGNELVTHITVNENEWMAKTKEGYFEGTPKATKSLFFVKGTKSFSLDQFFQQFYKPGILKQALSMSEERKVSTDIIGLLEESPPPVIEILAPEDGRSVKNNQLEIILKVTNAGGGIKDIHLHHNEKRLVIPDQLSRTPKAGQDMVLTYSVSLVPGDNEIAISGLSNGNIESKPDKRTIHFAGTQKEANLYIMAIGINEYENPSLTLNYARSDAESFARLVSQRSKKLFNNVETTVLLDKNASRENILSKLDELSKVIDKEDVFYFYYAGHGGTYEQEFYFIPTECVSLYQGDKLNEQAIPAKTVNEKLTTIPALKQVVILDACHAGASTKALASRGLLEEKALAQLARSTGIHIMAAAGSEQQAIEFGQLGHGVFTYALIEALEGKADGAPNDNKVTIYELKSYLDDQVPELSKKFQGKTQYPTTFSLGQDFPMVFGEN